MPLALVLFPGVAGAQLTINGAQTYQTIDGFGANINHRSWNGDELKPVLDTMVAEGFTIFRVVFDNTDWVTTNNASQAYYNSVYGSARFEKLWDLVAYLNQKGITNGVMFNFQGPGAEWMGGKTLTSGDEPQWAQMIASLVTYARNTRHLQFNLVAPGNEPDNSSQLVGVGASASQYVTMLHDLAQDLNSNGLSDVRLVGPDLANTSTSWMQGMINDSLIMSKLAHFGLHSYSSGGTGSSGVASFLSANSPGNTSFWMTEFNSWCPNCAAGLYQAGNYNWTFGMATEEYLLSHLANGASAGLAWEGYDSYYELLGLPTLPSGDQAAGWSYYGLFGVDDINAVPKTYTARKNFYAMAQISAFVPPGSQRIGVNGSSGVTLLAFYHAPSGRVTLTGYNTGNQTSLPITLSSLPAVASFDLYHTDANTNLSHDATYAVSGGGFTATVPANCVFTLTGFDPAKIAVSVQITNPAAGAYFTAPATIPIQAVASTTTGSISNVEFFNGTNDLGGSSNVPYGVTWSNVGPGTYVVTASATNSARNTGVSPGVTITVAGPAAQIMVMTTNTTVVSPTNATTVPHGQQLFTASVLDALGTPVLPPPPVAWSAGGGGTINGSGWFTADDSVGGPFAITATQNGLSGAAAVTIASNVNLAPNGIGYVWYNLPTSTANTSQYETPGINDGDVVDTVPLLPCCYDGSADFSGDYEAAGVVWAVPQTISSVVFINGAVSGGNGSFSAGFQLQITYDGSTWVQAGPQWTMTPAYSYNSSAASGVSYVFSGSMMTVLGVRCLGQVNTGRSASGLANATEVQAYLGAPPVLQATASTNGVVVSWNCIVTNCVLQFTTSDTIPWTTLTNARQTTGTLSSVTVSPQVQVGYFRLQFP
ncbi:MAG TPA: Ig-like domain-containing protein [Verrucomicrobiae bacterium]|nr:Ig-like domain-containing protein [Verrucomicrobiae bacterium]